eukprot:12820762-Alexandrium_andersonii.AAC.1
MVGWPSRRKRFYGAWISKRRLVLHSIAKAPSDHASLFTELFARALRLEGGIFLRAPRAQIDDLLFQSVQVRCLGIARDEVGNFDWRMLIDPAHRIRLRAHRNTLGEK